MTQCLFIPNTKLEYSFPRICTLDRSRKMAFWGVFVQPGQPYTLKLDGDQKRLRISQATLGERNIGLWRSRSSIQCAVGSKPPVSICSVSNEFPCCMLDLEFEESEDVVFSIRGPRGIHLSGYYVTPHAAERDTTTRTDDLKMYPYVQVLKLLCLLLLILFDLENNQRVVKISKRFPKNHPLPSFISSSNCNGEEEISEAENEKDRKMAKEEEEVGETGNFTLGGVDNSGDSNSGSDDVFVDACDILINTVLQELNVIDTGIESRGKADPLHSLGEHESEGKIKEIVEGCSKLTTLDADVGDFRNIDIQCDKALKARSGSNDMCQEDERNQQSQKSTANMVAGVPHSMLPEHEFSNEVGQESKKRRKCNDWKDMPRSENGKPTNNKFSNGDSEEAACPNNLNQSSDIRSENRQKTKKRKKTKVSKRKSLGQDSASFDNVQEKIKGTAAINGNMVRILPEDSKQKPTCDKSNDIYSHKKKKKKKQKIKGDKNVENLHSKSSQTRTSTNDLIIEELAAGKPDGEVSAPGKKVKIFYTARILDTGCLVESNVGSAPFKFRIGDKKIVKGWNIGVDGMRVGEKRRVTIPPSMGYGKRFPEVVPLDSWLVCDIELVSVC